MGVYSFDEIRGRLIDGDSKMYKVKDSHEL